MMRFLKHQIMISCMNNILFKLLNLSVFIILCTFYSSSQTTYYYKMVRKIENGKNSTEVKGGQFITFTNSLCYESDSKGKSVGHGQLVKTQNSEFLKL